MLAAEGFEPRRAADAREADRLLAAAPADVAPLDVMLPGEDGLSVWRRIGAAGDPPVIMVSALGSEARRVAGFEAGADDYVAKPFGAREEAAFEPFRTTGAARAGRGWDSACPSCAAAHAGWAGMPRSWTIPADAGWPPP